MGNEHGEWAGFTKIKNNKGVVVQAQCHSCNKLLTKRDAETLKKHRDGCDGTKTRKSRKRKSQNDTCSIQPRTSGNASSIVSHDLSSIDTQESNEWSENCVQLDDDVPEAVEEIECGYEDDSSFLDLEHSYVHKPRRKGGAENQTVATTKEKKRNIDILKFFLFHNISFESLSLPCTFNLLNGCDCNFTLPTPNVLKSNVLAYASTDNYRKNLEKNHTSIIHLKVYDKGDSYFLLALLISANAEDPTFVDYILIQKEPLTVSIKKLQEFCILIVEKVYNLYQIPIYFILHDGVIDVYWEKSMSIVYKDVPINIIFTLCVGLDTVITNLIDMELTFSIRDSSLIAQFRDDLQKLKNDIIEKNLKMFHAIELLFVTLEKHSIIQSLAHAAKFKETLNSHIKGLHLACNFLHSEHRGLCFIEYIDLFNSMESYVRRTSPPGVFNALGYYKDKDGFFKTLYSEGHNAMRFWESAQSEKRVRNIAEFALILMKVTGSTITIDMKLLCDKMMAQSSKDCNVNSLIFSVVYENSARIR